MNKIQSKFYQPHTTRWHFIEKLRIQFHMVEDLAVAIFVTMHPCSKNQKQFIKQVTGKREKKQNMLVTAVYK